MLNDSGNLKFDFKLMVNDEKFDNDDNPYGKFIFHLYTNMDNLTDTEQNATVAGKDLSEFNDLTIPLIECSQDLDVIWRNNQIKQYCPNYGDWAFIYGTFYTTRFARLRLALHFCDDAAIADEERKRMGKKYEKCVSKKESLDYF